jgi:hypothetical protein
MSIQYRYVQIGVSVVAWSAVLLVATYRSHTPVVFGQYSRAHVILLGLLVCIAVMAEHLANDIVRYWTKKSSSTKVAHCVRSTVTEIKSFAMGLTQTLSEARSYFVSLYRSCKRVIRHLMSSGSHLLMRKQQHERIRASHHTSTISRWLFHHKSPAPAWGSGGEDGKT